MDNTLKHSTCVGCGETKEGRGQLEMVDKLVSRWVELTYLPCKCSGSGGECEFFVFFCLVGD